MEFHFATEIRNHGTRAKLERVKPQPDDGACLTVLLSIKQQTLEGTFHAAMKFTEMKKN